MTSLKPYKDKYFIASPFCLSKSSHPTTPAIYVFQSQHYVRQQTIAERHTAVFPPRARRFKSTNYNLPCHHPFSFFVLPRTLRQGLAQLKSGARAAKASSTLLPSLVCKDGSQNEADVPTES